MYTIKDDEVYENGRPTGIKPAYTKKGLRLQYNWSKNTLARRLETIEHMIYERKRDGTYERSKKTFSPTEVCAIYNWFGLP